MVAVHLLRVRQLVVVDLLVAPLGVHLEGDRARGEAGDGVLDVEALLLRGEVVVDLVAHGLVRHILREVVIRAACHHQLQHRDHHRRHPAPLLRAMLGDGVVEAALELLLVAQQRLTLLLGARP